MSEQNVSEIPRAEVVDGHGVHEWVKEAIWSRFTACLLSDKDFHWAVNYLHSRIRKERTERDNINA